MIRRCAASGESQICSVLLQSLFRFRRSIFTRNNSALNPTEIIMPDDKIKILEERLTRLEAALSQQQSARGGFTTPGGAVVDPAPNPGGWGYPRPFPRPVVDPAPYPWWGGGYGPRPWPPQYVVDPPPYPSFIVDPAPSPNPVFDQSLLTDAVRANFGRFGPVGDPPPIDISRFNASQLESSLHTINSERARLDSMEKLIKQQLDRLKKQGA